MQLDDTIDYMTMSKKLLKVKQKVTDILLMSNGSTTRLLEAIIGQDMKINVLNQDIILKNELCDEYNAMLENSNTYLKRKVSLHRNGRIFSDNLVIASIDNIPEEIKAGLFQGKIPLGKLIGNRETKRKLLWTGYVNKNSLYADFVEREFPLAEYPAKQYLIYVNGCCWFYILEVFHVDEITHFFWN